MPSKRASRPIVTVEDCRQAAEALGLPITETDRGFRTQAVCHGGDHLNNLAIDAGQDGRTLVYCHSQGCDHEAVFAALGVTATGEPRDPSAPRSAPTGRQRPDPLTNLQARKLPQWAAQLASAPELLRKLKEERALSGEVIALYQVGVDYNWKRKGEAWFIVPQPSWLPREKGQFLGYIAYSPKSMRGDVRGVDVKKDGRAGRRRHLILTYGPWAVTSELSLSRSPS